MKEDLIVFFSSIAAVRAATLGSWRMLTLGAEYKDKRWGSSPEDNHHLKQRSEEEEEELATMEQTDTHSGDTKKVHTWKECHFSSVENYDAFLCLQGLSRVGERNGVLQMVKKHGHLNGTTRPRR